MRKRWIGLSICALSVVALGQRAGGQSWLYPSRAEMRRAVAAGFSRKGPRKKYALLDFEGAGFVSAAWEVTLVPPLACAAIQGEQAWKTLAPKPRLKAVMALCDGRVEIQISHFSRSLNASWPAVLRRGSNIVRPVQSDPDGNPAVTTATEGFAGRAAGYQYLDQYFFEPPKAWASASGADIVYADGSGKHHTLHCKFKKLAKDESRRR